MTVQIANPQSFPATSPMALMKKLQAQSSTHTCPGCGKPTYCSMVAGKSASTCWCMTAQPADGMLNADPSFMNDHCYCKDCLTQGDPQQ